MTSKEMVKIAYNAIDDKKGMDISIIDISKFQFWLIIL